MIVATLDSLLDNPIWNSLTSHRSNFAEGGDLARRFRSEIGPLAGIKDQSPEAYAELGGLLSPGEYAVLFLDSAPTPPPGWRVHVHSSGDQMICIAGRGEPHGDSGGEFGIQPLDEADVPEMLELTALTDPGPFRARTIELGGFLGIREDGRLAAMAGLRLAMPGYAEVTAVCTHPDFRGRGYARALVSAVARTIHERGETPILHVYSANTAAIRVYEGLGFVLRRKLHVAIVVPPSREA
jgi:ribosomal protein S18 acetylase RimI-like enzyme